MAERETDNTGSILYCPSPCVAGAQLVRPLTISPISASTLITREWPVDNRTSALYPEWEESSVNVCSKLIPEVHFYVINSDDILTIEN